MPTLDLQIQNKCDHVVRSEIIYFNRDSSLFLLGRPIMSPTELVLFKNKKRLKYGVDFTVVRSQGNLVPNAVLDSVRLLVTGAELSEALAGAVYRVSYTTARSFCPKCIGSSWTDDIIQSSYGDSVLVSSIAQLVQSVEKQVRTRSGSSPYNRWAGSSLEGLVGRRITSDNLVLKTEIKENITSSLQRLKKAQIEHGRINANVSDSEVLGDILSFSFKEDKEDPTYFEVVVKYTSLGGQVADLALPIRLSEFK